ncbi:transposase [Roseibium aquae]|uniref:Transposase n=1 Tax=Roseibium aquae TaxID=1323746 RepID=A0A916X2J8_9HYPH|nr:DDE-type integrase/transposase/recombinase [Roseibium aquae]GGB55340.1 transposase [Roseibium aquae]
MKLWHTAQDLADLKLDGFPGTKRGVHKLIEREGWADTPLCRRRSGSLGGGGFEYHIDLLPLPQKLAYAARFICVEPDDFACETHEDLTTRERTTRDARLIVLKVAERFHKQSGMGQAVSDHLFSQAYRAGQVAVPEWVHAEITSLSRRTLSRWRAHMKRDLNRLGSDPSFARKGKGILDRAEQGRLRAWCLALHASNPFLAAKHIRTAALAEFGPSVLIDGKQGQRRVAMPPLRTFQDALKRWKETHRNELLKITDPDAYKSTIRFAATGANRRERLNEVWEIDASPSDVMTTDGRKTIYAAIDLYSRRCLLLICDTPRAAAVGLLLRKCLMAWGVPEEIVTDNGSDFVARATKRLLDALGIEHDPCEPHAPEQKGTVERLIGTFQRDCAATLPGFIGHNVADRKVIEARKAFSARLGTEDAKLFHVEMSAAELQAEADRWALQQYAHTPHAGLKGKTPFQAAQAWNGDLRAIKDPAVLDVLLAPVPGSDGLRRVTKLGIRVDGSQYLTGDVMPGRTILCRHNPDDLGRLWLFEPDGETYLGEALCPDLAGLDPAATIAEVRARQKALETDALADIRKAKRRITPRTVAEAQRAAYQMNADILAFPKPARPHETPQSLAARAAKQKPKPQPLSGREAAMFDRLTQADKPAVPATVPATVHALAAADTPESRFQRALQLEARLAEGTPLSDRDALWLTGYREGPEYRARKLLSDHAAHSIRGPRRPG